MVVIWQLCVQADLDLTHEEKLGIIMIKDEYLKLLDLLQLKQVIPWPGFKDP